MHAHLVQVAAALKALHAAFHDQQRQRVGVFLRVGLGRDNNNVRVDAVGNIGLGTVQQEMVAHVLRVGAHARQVTARIGLGHGHGQDGISFDAARQEALALFLGAEILEVRSHQSAVQGVEPLATTGATGFFHDDLLVAEIAVAHAAILFLRPDHKEALVPGFLENFPVDDTLLAKARHMGLYFALQEFPVGAPEHLLFFCKRSHAKSSCEAACSNAICGGAKRSPNLCSSCRQRSTKRCRP